MYAFSKKYKNVKWHLWTSCESNFANLMTHETLRNIVMTTQNQSSDKIIKCWDGHTFHRAGISNISAIVNSSHRLCQIDIVSTNLRVVVLLSAPLSSSELYAACDTVSPVSPATPASVTRRGHRPPIRAQMSGGGGTHRVWGGWPADKGCAARDEMLSSVLYLTMWLRVRSNMFETTLLSFQGSILIDLPWRFFLSILFPKDFVMGQQLQHSPLIW